jgi:hypothetical protein
MYYLAEKMVEYLTLESERAQRNIALVREARRIEQKDGASWVRSLVRGFRLGTRLPGHKAVCEGCVE